MYTYKCTVESHYLEAHGTVEIFRVIRNSKLEGSKLKELSKTGNSVR